jgi:3-oxoacyl-(acyl-carrier-protein) synthase
MRGALQQAHLQPNEIDHIEAHGTGTRANDAMEIAAIRSVFAEHASRVSISSVKSMIGHCLGAAGSIELVATILGMQGDFIPPTLNLEERMQGSDDLNISRPTAATSRVNAALSNSFVFGGNVAAIAVRRLDQQLLG